MQSQQYFWCSRCMGVYSVLLKVSHSMIMVTEVRISSKMKLVSVNSIKLMTPPHQCSLFVLGSRMKLTLMWYICVGMTRGIRFQNTDKKSHSVYSASFPIPLPWYWNVPSFEVNNKSRISASELKFMRHKKCILKDCRRNQDNLYVLRLNKHDQRSELHRHMNLPHSE